MSAKVATTSREDFVFRRFHIIVQKCFTPLGPESQLVTMNYGGIFDDTYSKNMLPSRKRPDD